MILVAVDGRVLRRWYRYSRLRRCHVEQSSLARLVSVSKSFEAVLSTRAGPQDIGRGLESRPRMSQGGSTRAWLRSFVNRYANLHVCFPIVKGLLQKTPGILLKENLKCKTGGVYSVSGPLLSSVSLFLAKYEAALFIRTVRSSAARPPREGKPEEKTSSVPIPPPSSFPERTGTSPHLPRLREEETVRRQRDGERPGRHAEFSFLYGLAGVALIHPGLTRGVHAGPQARYTVLLAPWYTSASRSTAGRTTAMIVIHSSPVPKGALGLHAAACMAAVAARATSIFSMNRWCACEKIAWVVWGEGESNASP